MTTVLALGGHPLAQDGLEEVRSRPELLPGERLVITHGNGPQVGELLLLKPDGIYRDFRKPQAARIERLTAEEALVLAPRLPPGSMGPKLAACGAFVAATGGSALVTSPAGLERGEGTRIEP